MLKRGEWLDRSRKLDWDFSYVTEEEVFPELMSGRPWLPRRDWRGWREPFRTSYADYVTGQADKDASLQAVREAVFHLPDVQRLHAPWISALKLHSAVVPLTEFAAVVGSLRGARFGRDSAWRTVATFGALDEIRHAQIPLVLMHELVRWDPQFNWTHRFFHTNDWVAIAARHVFDEMLLGASAVEYAIATNFVFETGFTNVQFVGLASLAHAVGDRMFEKMVTSIQSDEARHSQIGPPVLAVVAARDPAYAQYLVDKWFWRSFLLFAIVTGFAMDYFAPVESRTLSFKEFVHEWIVDQYLRMLEEHGLRRPWYWDVFLSALDTYHHMVYASAYTYRSSVWFDFVVPGPRERAWLRAKYPSSFHLVEPVWERIDEGWRAADGGDELAVHGAAMVAFCDLCQLVLSGGAPARNTATVLERGGRKYVFCSEPCRWIFEQEPERYAEHRDVVKRVLAGEAPAGLAALRRDYFGLDPETWGKDLYRGAYPWLASAERVPPRPGAPRVPSAPASAGGAALVPLYGFVEGDTMGLLILADPSETIGALADELQQAASVRVAPRPRVRVVHAGRALDPGETPASAGIVALDRLDVRADEAPP